MPRSTRILSIVWIQTVCGCLSIPWLFRLQPFPYNGVAGLSYVQHKTKICMISNVTSFEACLYKFVSMTVYPHYFNLFLRNVPFYTVSEICLLHGVVLMMYFKIIDRLITTSKLFFCARGRMNSWSLDIKLCTARFVAKHSIFFPGFYLYGIITINSQYFCIQYSSNGRKLGWYCDFCEVSSLTEGPWWHSG
jgi:hypothetical protein